MIRCSSHVRFVCVAIALALVVAETASAQDRGPRRGRGGFRGGPPGMEKVALLQADSVVAELAISPSQQDKIRAAADESRQKGRELFQGFRDLSESERGQMRTKMEALAAETNQKLTEILTDAQNKRLDEILIQIRGPHSLNEDAVAEQLGLSKEQRQNIADLVDSERAEQRERFAALRDLPREQMREKFDELRKQGEAARKATDEMLLAELTDAQKTQFQAMGGKPFEVDREELFGGRFGGRGGRDGRPGGGRPGGGRRGNGGGNGGANQ